MTSTGSSDALLLDALRDALSRITDHAQHTQGKPPARIYIACSGGRDSVALAHACWRLYQSDALDALPHLIHVNHHLQSTSDAWVIWVQDFGQRLHLPTIVRDAYPKHNEQSARDARYQAFFAVMADDDVLLMAHHADDQAETVLMRLIHGAGVAGLSGIKPWQTKHDLQDDKSNKRIHLVRPWLHLSRNHIDTYCATHALDYLDDPTNWLDAQVTMADSVAQGTANLRAILRTHILPSLRTLNPKVDLALCRTADHLSVLDDFIDRQVHTQLDKVCTDHISHQELDIDQLLSLHPALQSLVVQAFVQGDEYTPCSAKMVTDILTLANRQDNDHQAQLIWQGKRRWVIVRYDAWLYRYAWELWRALHESHALNFYYDTACDAFIHPALALHLPASPYDRQTLHHHQRIDRHTRVRLGALYLHGKKLYQTLRIPPWLRAHLWLMDRGDERLLVSIGKYWPDTQEGSAKPFLVHYSDGSRIVSPKHTLDYHHKADEHLDKHLDQPNDALGLYRQLKNLTPIWLTWLLWLENTSRSTNASVPKGCAASDCIQSQQDMQSTHAKVGARLAPFIIDTMSDSRLTLITTNAYLTVMLDLSLQNNAQRGDGLTIHLTTSIKALNWRGKILALVMTPLHRLMITRWMAAIGHAPHRDNLDD